MKKEVRQSMPEQAMAIVEQGVIPNRKKGDDAIGLAKLVTLGQSAEDTFFQRQSKAILVSFLVVFSGFASLALLDPGRPPFVHLLDSAVIVGSVGIMIVLWWTKSLPLAFSVVCSVGLGLLFLFFLMVGNRGADLMMPLVFPLLSVVIAGPRRSQKWFIAMLIMVGGLPFLQPHLPQTTLSFFESAENPTGSLFYAPFKEPLDFETVILAITTYCLIYGIVYAAYAQMIHARKKVKRQRVELAASYAKSEKLLLNILPASVVDRLKENPDAVIADDLEDVVILFADIVNFTETSADLPASEVVSLLNKVFSSFDDLVATAELEKIKTSGDAYMVAAGIGAKDPQDIARIADLALGMLASVQELNAIHRPKVAVRVGIHAGRATAGVVGSLKFYYDIWGDTVNMAARLQTAAEPGSIRVSGTVREALGQDYRFENRGKTALKGKGDLETFSLLHKAEP